MNCQGGFQGRPQSFPGRPAFARCRVRSHLACVRKPLPLTAQGSGTSEGRCGERLRTSPEKRGDQLRRPPSLGSHTSTDGEDGSRTSRGRIGIGTSLPEVPAMLLQSTASENRVRDRSSLLHQFPRGRRGIHSLRPSARRCSVQRSGRWERCCRLLRLSRTTGCV